MNDRNAISDLFAAGNEGANGKRIVQCNANTLNTPYKAGLTGGASGTAYLNISSATYGTILYIASGSNCIFLACKAGGTWGDWIEVVTNADLRNIFSGRDNYIDTLSSIQQLTTPGFYKIDNISSAVNDNTGSNPLSDYAAGDFYGLLMGEVMNSTNGCRYGTLVLTSPRLVGDLWVGNIWDYKFAGWYKK